MSRLLHFGLTLFLLQTSTAQNRPCALDIPLNVLMPDTALVRGLHQGAFVARLGNSVLDIPSVDVDTGPRRIVIVAENGKKLNPAARKVEATILGAIVRDARPADSIALLTAVGPHKELPLGTKRELLLSTIEDLSAPPREKGEGRSTFEVVQQAAGWLQPFQPGDSIILLTMGLVPGAPGYARAREALTDSGIRLFGLQLGRILIGTYSTGIASTPGGGILPTARVDPNTETMLDLADETGGFFLEENTEGDPQRSYHLTEERLQLVAKLGDQLNKGVGEYYRLRFFAPPKGYIIDLADSVREKLPKAHMVYPRRMPRCSSLESSSPPN
jgi:hypothetical protein